MALPATITHHHHPMNILSILNKEKNGYSNLLYWHQNQRIVIIQQKKNYVLEGLLPKVPTPTPKATHDIWFKHYDESIDVVCLMLVTMIPYL